MHLITFDATALKAVETGLVSGWVLDICIINKPLDELYHESFNLTPLAHLDRLQCHCSLTGVNNLRLAALNDSIDCKYLHNAGAIYQVIHLEQSLIRPLSSIRITPMSIF